MSITTRASKTLLIHTCFQLLLATAFAQPYVDPLQIRYTHAFQNKNKGWGTPFDHLWIGSDLPIELKNKSYLLLSPFYENWQIDSGSAKILPTVHGAVLPVGVLLPLENKKWMISLNFIVRSNGEKLFDNNTFQYGGVGFASYEKSPGKKFRFGAYLNTDFFGLFFIPLIGADWRLDNKNYLFGLLPGRLTWEHEFNEKIFGGITFRAITNSYRLQDGQYVRLDDNQLSVYSDLYASKHVCFTLESGYGILRKLRTGIDKKNYMIDEKWGDGLFIKLSAAYRIRLPK